MKVTCVREDEEFHLLEVGKTYNVEGCVIHGWRTDVYLEEFPNKPFNSVIFDDDLQKAFEEALDYFNENWDEDPRYYGLFERDY